MNVVAHVVLTLNAGGQEYLVIQLAERLQRRGIRSPVIALSGGALIDDARQLGLTAIDLHKKEGLRPSTLFKLCGVLRRERVDVVHTHNFAPLIYGTLAARMSGVPTINTRHGRAALSTYPLIWRLTDRVVAVSEDARRELLRHNTIAPEKVSVILNGVDVDAFDAPQIARSTARAALGIAANAVVFGIVARLAPEKDHATLIEAFGIMKRRKQAAHLLIVGGGPLEPALRAHAERLDLSRDVHFLGFRKDISALLRCLDVFVLSSSMEGISLTLLEAMAAGLPIVATDVGGNPEVVVAGETGLLVPPGDPTAMADAMASFHGNATYARDCGERGRARATRIFDISRMVDAYVDLYSAVRR